MPCFDFLSENVAAFLAFALLDTIFCPRMMALFAGSYCKSVEMVLFPFLVPRCWQNRFSIMSELIYPGVIVCPLCTWSLQKGHKSIYETVDVLESLSSDKVFILAIKCWFSYLWFPCLEELSYLCKRFGSLLSVVVEIRCVSLKIITRSDFSLSEVIY